jgi:hypothetical protein
MPRETHPAIVAVLADGSSGGHWIYYEDGTVMLFDPRTGTVDQVRRLPQDFEHAVRETEETRDAAMRAMTKPKRRR